MRKNLYVSSSARTSGSASDFTIAMEYPFTSLPRKVRLLSSTIPYTWNNIIGNTLYINEGADVLITVPLGNYTPTQLATVLTSTINAAGLGFVYTVSYNSSLRKYTISATGAFTLKFTSTNPMNLELGFAAGFVGGPAASFTSSTAAALPPGEVMIHSGLVEGSDNGQVPAAASTSSAAILSVVPITASFGSYNYVAQKGTFFSAIQSGLLSSGIFTVTFSLKFPSGSVIDLKGSEWSCILEVEL